MFLIEMLTYDLQEAIPLNTDTVSCTPIFEIRESQSASAPMNQFGGGGSSATQYATTGNNPGPPYTHSSLIDMEQQSVPAFVPSQSGTQMNLPTRDRNASGGFGLSDDHDMDDAAPSPATTNSQSRGGSTSHTSLSYSPAAQQQQLGDAQNLRFGNSPKNPQSQMPLPQSTTPSNNANFFTVDNNFAGGFYPTQGGSVNDPFSQGFLGNEWDMNAMGAGTGAGTGMTPMSESSWNQMLEGIQLGWVRNSVVRTA